jgi:hypothetical protein
MIDLGPWSDEDFERLSWHDVHVHAVKLEEFDGENGSADLLLDIDYILKWEQVGTGYIFTVCQAVLRFQQVFGLRFTLDYKTPTAGMCPFSINGIEREPMEAANGYRSFRWHLPINRPAGSIEFEAPSFTQTLIGSPSVQPEQYLAQSKRHNTPAASQETPDS